MKKLAALAALLLAQAAAAQSVSLQGMMGNRALLIVDGGMPRAVAPGDSYLGIKVVSTQGDQAVLEIDGVRRTLRIGDAPASVGGGATGSRGSRIVLTAASDGHFMTLGSINGRSANFLVDTGATSVAMSAAQAERAGIDYRKGQPGLASTANGTVQSWRVRLNSVRIGDVEVFDVDASVLPMPMPYVLLGNSFLTRFQMKRENNQLVLERRY